MNQEFKSKYRKDNVKPLGQFGGRICASCGGKIEGGYRLLRMYKGHTHLATYHKSSKSCERINGAK